VAVKIVRQPNKIALLGAPTSAASLALGHERAPAALRAAGLVEGLRNAGYEVNDLGDDPVQLFQPDNESPRARNLPRVLKSIEALKPRVEIAVKSGALPLILGGDCSIALATVAGLRRYFRNVSMLYMDSDADLNIPATTHSGCIDGMVVSHLGGRGAAELVRFWPEPPLVRDPDIALFGVGRLDPPEEEFLRTSPIRRYLASDVKRLGATAAAEAAVAGIHGGSNVIGHEFVLHFDVDVIAGAEFGATNLPAADGLSFEEARQALEVFTRQNHLAAMEVTAYNPERDPDGSAAKKLVDLVVSVLAARLAALTAAAPEKPSLPGEAAPAPASPESATVAEETRFPETTEPSAEVTDQD
jgi:arginase